MVTPMVIASPKDPPAAVSRAVRQAVIGIRVPSRNKILARSSPVHTRYYAKTVRNLTGKAPE